jgi:phytol kinase
MQLIFACVPVLVMLIVAEVSANHHVLNGEGIRKLVHIVVGTYVAFWPFMLDWNDIRILSLAFAAIVFVSTRIKVFQSVRSVRRLSYGEMFFALSVGFLTLITESKGIYAAAILQMAWADGAAALIGQALGKNTQYKIFGQVKSGVGTLAFLSVSLAILIGYAHYSVAGLGWEYVIFAALGATLLENMGVLGLDNLLAPAYVGLLLKIVA